MNSKTDRKLSFLTIEPHILASSTLARWFEEETGVQVAVSAAPYANISERAASDARGNAREFDVFQVWYPMLGWLAEKQILLDLRGWWDENAAAIQPADFVPVFRDAFCLAGERRYGIPYDGDLHLLFYNTGLLSKYGFQPPTTWDEYLEIAKTITQAEKGKQAYGCGIMAANIPLILIGTYLNRLAGFGGSFFGDQGNPALTSPEAIAALEHLLSELPYAQPDPCRVAFDEMLGPWLSGRVAMAEFWADLGKITDNPEQSQIPHGWGVVPMPKGPEPKGTIAAPLNAGWSLGLSARANQPELALEFLKFSLREDIQLRMCTINGGLDPVRWSTYANPEYRKFVSEPLADAAQSAVKSAAVAWPSGPNWPDLQEVLHKNLYLAVSGTKPARQALEDTQAAWESMIGQ